MNNRDFSIRPVCPGAIALPGHPRDDDTSIALRLSQMLQRETDAQERQYQREIEEAIACSLGRPAEEVDLETAIVIDTTEITSNPSIHSIQQATIVLPTPVASSTPSCTRSRALLYSVIFFIVLVAVVVPVAIVLSPESVHGQGIASSTPVPVAAPTVDRVAAISKIIRTAAPQVTFVATLQNEALAWLAEEDPANLPLDSDPSVFVERYAMIMMYFTTNGSDWGGLGFELIAFSENLNEYWLSEKNTCFWAGVSCGLGESAVLLRMFDGIAGTLPTELGLLTNLKRLHLVSNIALVGTIPSEMGKLTNLVELWLSRNSLVGTIPTELGALTNLRSLKLDGNVFTGTIPSEIKQLNIADIDTCCNGYNGLAW